MDDYLPFIEDERVVRHLQHLLPFEEVSEKVLRAEQILREFDSEEQVVLYHSGDASIDGDLANAIVPQFGDWLEECLAGATDDENAIEEIRESDPVAFYSEDPSWIDMKAARAAGKHPSEVTIDDIRIHGQLCILLVDKSDSSVWRADEDGQGKASQFWGWDDDTMFDLPFGVEPGDIFTSSVYTPEITLTGDDLITFLNRNFPQYLPKEELSSLLSRDASREDAERLAGLMRTSLGDNEVPSPAVSRRAAP